MRHTGCLRSHFGWRDKHWHFEEYLEYLILKLKFNAPTAVIIAHLALHGK